jgi:hypothetical protein
VCSGGFSGEGVGGEEWRKRKADQERSRRDEAGRRDIYVYIYPGVGWESGRRADDAARGSRSRANEVRANGGRGRSDAGRAVAGQERQEGELSPTDQREPGDKTGERSKRRRSRELCCQIFAVQSARESLGWLGREERGRFAARQTRRGGVAEWG